MAGNQGGPAGTGLIPEGAAPPEPDPDPIPEPPEDPPLEPPAPPTADIDGTPPVPETERGDPEPDDDGEFIDPDAFRDQILDEVQKRFDKAISKINRKTNAPPAPEGGGDPPPPTSRPDITSIRFLARQRIAEEMEGAGRDEVKTVRTVLDDLLPHLAWDSVEDADDFVEDLVKRLSGVANDMINVGASRKVAQLRQSGVLPPAPRQPGTAPTSTVSVSSGMAQGAAAAKKRWPSGKRRFGG